MSQSENDHPPSRRQVERSPSAAVGGATQPDSGQRNGSTASSSSENGSLNGDAKRGGKSRRRKKRLSNPDSSHEGSSDGKAEHEEDWDKGSNQPPDPYPELIGLQSECSNVWFEHGAYEQAESFYHCWLATSSNGIKQSNHSAPTQQVHLNAPVPVVPSSPGLACRHGDQVACHHVVQEVWVNKSSFDQAECRFVEESLQPSIPNSLDLSDGSNHPVMSRTPDEGYQSLAATPATPIIQQSAPEPINGLPLIPVELLRDVWLEKPAYDRAEAAYYQNLYGNHSAKRPSCSSASRNNKHPQSLVEEEEEDEEEVVVVPVEKRVVLQTKAEVFHALHPIQEEEEPAEVPETEEAPEPTFYYFLHPDSERVWSDKWQYDAAESRFHGNSRGGAMTVLDVHRPGVEGSSVPSPALLRDKAMDVLTHEKIWFDKHRYDEAERCFYENMNNNQPQEQTQEVGAKTILQDIARARENIQKSLAGSTNSCVSDPGEFVSRMKSLELENQNLHKVVEDLRAALSKLECRVAVLEKCPATPPSAPPSAPCTNGTPVEQTSSSPGKDDDGDDDDFDLFGSDEDSEAEQIKEQRLQEYAARKAKKPALIAKSSILLDVKPWDDETDMAKLEVCVRSVQADGLLWGVSKLVPVGYGIRKLQIACVVEDDKVGTDLLEEEIVKFEDYVQSVDVAAFNKI